MKVQETLRRDRRPRVAAADAMVARSTAFDSLATSNLTASATVTAGSANTKGSWTTLFDPTVGDLNTISLIFSATGTPATDTGTLMDIGIGSAGNEVVVVPNIQIGFFLATTVISVPIHIPSGSRIAIRSQSAVAAKAVVVTATAGSFRNGTRAPSALDAVGANTATSRGVALNNSGTNNTPGSWVELTSATTKGYQGFLLGADLAGDTDVPTSNVVVELGTGASGQETSVGAWHLATSTAEGLFMYSRPDLDLFVPAGTRLSARVRFATASNSSMGVSLLAVPTI